MRTLAIAAVTAAVLVAPAAFAQDQPSSDPLVLKWEAEKKEQERVERDYNAMMKKTQRGAVATGKADPWGTVRPVQNQPKDKPR